MRPEYFAAARVLRPGADEALDAQARLQSDGALLFLR
jgi:hypothetical protein